MLALSVLPIVAALDQLEVDPDRVSTVAAAPGGRVVAGRRLSEVPDPRKARGVRHGVLAVLTLSACAVLAGARPTLAALAATERCYPRTRTLGQTAAGHPRLARS